MAPSVSIVITNFNGKRFLEPCLSSLASQSFTDFETILVDNNSVDGSVDNLGEKFPQLTIIRNPENIGFAGGTNAGIRAAHGKYILTLNNDTIADPRFVENLVRPMAADPHIGMCASKMLFPDGRINSTGICISRSGAAWDRGIFEEDSGQYDTECDVFGPCAGAALYRCSMLDEIGLFDEDFFIFMEDVDLAFRARLAGWGCRYIPTAKIVHFYGGTAVPESDTAVYYGNRNLLWNVIKNFPMLTLFKSFPWIFFRNCADIPFYLFRGKGRTILHAKIDCAKGIPKMWRKRRYDKPEVCREDIERWIQIWRTRTSSV